MYNADYMARAHTLAVFGFIALFLVPNFSYAGFYITEDTKTICEATMAHDSLVPKFLPYELNTTNAGEYVERDVLIKNVTSASFKNTRLLLKVFFYDKESEGVNDDRKYGKLIDVELLPDSYDIGGGSSVTARIKWKSQKEMSSGLYRMDIYVVQNGIHVIGDYARPNTVFSNMLFRIRGTDKVSPVSISLDNTLLDEYPYQIYKMPLFSENENNDKAVISIKNSDNKVANVNFTWKVYRYGKFDDANLLTSSSSIIGLKPNAETKVVVEVPSTPNDRYSAIIDTEYDGQHRMSMMRWARYIDVPPSIDNYGIVHDGKVITSSSSPVNFALKEGERYIAYTCIIGGYKESTSTIKMELKDEDGDVIFSKEETLHSGKETAAFEYPFVATKFAKKIQLNISAKTGPYTSLAVWNSDCGNDKNTECQNPAKHLFPLAKYVFSTLTIGLLFLIIFVIKNYKLSKH